MTFVLAIAFIILAAVLRDTRKRLASLEERVKTDAMRWHWAPAGEHSTRPEPLVVAEENVAESPIDQPDTGFNTTTPLPAWQEEAAAIIPPPIQDAQAEALEANPVPAPKRPLPAFEDLFGRKLPIWAGGFTLLIAAALLVRYSIDAGLLSPIVRVTMAILFGCALVAGAEMARRKPALVSDARIPQALAGAGIGSLYAATLAAANLYGLIGPAIAFGGLAAITAFAMGLALRFGAPSALLGLVGGLAAPALVQSQAPNPPLLAAYIALVVGALTLLSRRQRWYWLGISALVGGAGWSALIIAMGQLDSLSTVCIGALILLLGLGFPVLAATGRTAPLLRGAAALVGALQLAALVATGHFAPLTWGLYGLLSAGFVWMTMRTPALRPLVVLPLLTALALLAFWPRPDAAMFATVLAGLTLIYGGSALRYLRHHAGMPEAVSLAAIALAGYGVTCWHFTPSHAAVLALGFAALPALGALLTWTGAREPQGEPFALQAFASAVMIAIAALTACPEWTAPVSLAAVAAAVLALATKTDNRWLSHGALLALASGIAALALTGSATAEFQRLFEDLPQVAIGAALLRWGAFTAAAIGFARMLTATRRGIATQVLAALLAYGTVAQILPAHWLGTACALALVMLAEVMRRRDGNAFVALATLGVLAGIWTLHPLGLWLTAGLISLTGSPVLVAALPMPGIAIRQLLLPALLVGITLWRQPLQGSLRMPVTSGIGVLILIAAHILYKQCFALSDLDAFANLGLAERIVWQALLIGAGAILLKLGRHPAVGLTLIGAGLAHALVYTVVLHNPLWSVQAVGAWPVVNLLVPAYALIFAALALFGRHRRLTRLLDAARILMIPIFACSLLRQMFTGSLLANHPVGPVETIGWSLLAVGLAIGYLAWGLRKELGDWRIASLVLMLAAAGKVFLLDTSGLAGLLRILSFLALGFSLIGIGWLYSRYLRPAPLIATPSDPSS